ncbi:MAG TPA: glycosyl hydrolase, partial [Gemmatimonadaceae bacterium]|nr:glycosyl hydrolase [Gemmatimonadaceae bacterium]
GGVWRTTNGGQSWQNVSDDRANDGGDIAGVGAIAVAPSDPNVIYVGGGERDPREDVTYGQGMYRSTDGGESWQHLGLADTHQITAIRVHPSNADVAYVTALGHTFGANAERGVYRTNDGGKTWRKALFLDDSTGFIDLTMDPTNPRILYAAAWKFRRMPWGMNQGGGRTGIWKTADGGDTWTELTANPGIPKGPLGRIGLAVSPAMPNRVYASIEAPDSSGGIFRTDDAGTTWTRVNGEQKFHVRAWYYSTIVADPVDANTVYVLNLGTWRSVDGGTTYTRIRVPHGDCHMLWIDPKDPSRMIHGNDGGATVSFDAGESWSSIYNQPTAQFYHVTTDNQFPYRIYGAQQDNTTLSMPSRSDDGAIGYSQMYSVGGGENAYIAIQPDDPNIVYAGLYMGLLTRYDHRTRSTKDISVWLDNYDGIPAAQVPYRFQWTFPVLISPHDSTVLYVSSQYVHRSTDRGQSWTKVSPDLTAHEPATLGPSGGPVHYDMTGTEWYATIFALAESPLQKGVLWAGSDDGLVHVSRDNGATWQNVTPRGIPRLTRISIIEPSRYDAGTAYVAGNRYQQDDFAPYLWKTTDYGRSWTRIDRGIPVGSYTRAIREDPVRRGLLFAGTETGVFVSFDDGQRWQSLQLNLPRAVVRDLRVHGNDLIAATHGRSMWAMHDISVLRQLADSVRRAEVHLFAPAQVVRFRSGGSSRSHEEAVPNPPCCAVFDYYFARKPQGEVKLEILDAKGGVVRTFSSKGEKKDADSTRADSVRRAQQSDTSTVKPPEERPLVGGSPTGPDTASFEPADSVVAARAGANRFVWDLKYAQPRWLKDIVIDYGTVDAPVAVPGQYTVRLTANGRAVTRPFTVVPDPRVGATQRDLEAQHALAWRVREDLDRVAQTARRIAAMQRQLDERVTQTKEQAYASRVADAAKTLRRKLEEVRAELIEVNSQADQITLHYPIKIYNKLISLNDQVQSGDGAPSKQHGEIFDELRKEVETQYAKLRDLESKDVPAFNQLMRELEVPAVLGAEPVVVP